jgi:DNA-binding beta-propeller fold protein YncE
VVTNLAGTAAAEGSADGKGAAALFNNPIGIARDATGNLYVADTLSNTIRKLTPAGVVTTLAGKAGAKGSADGNGAAARFQAPVGVACDAAGNIYVTDNLNDTIREITPAGMVSTLAGSVGVAKILDGSGAAARFDLPGGIACDSAGNLYVTEGAPVIRKIFLKH